MTWVAVALAVVAAGLAVALVFVMATLPRTIRSLQAVVDDLNREAVPLLADLEGDARKASQGLDRVGDLVGAAESVTRRVDGASKLAYCDLLQPGGEGAGRRPRCEPGGPPAAGPAPSRVGKNGQRKA